MSTRSRIGILNSDSTITSIYCHHDGYPSHVGRILQENYNTEKSIRNLISNGDASAIEPTIESCHFYNEDEESEAYVSDEAEFYHILKEEFNYLYKNGVWSCNKQSLSELL